MTLGYAWSAFLTTWDSAPDCLRWAGAAGEYLSQKAVRRMVSKNTPAHPGTMHLTLKEAPVRRDHYATTQQLNEHLHAFLLAHHHAKRRKTLRGLTPHEFVCVQWQKNSTIFTRDPTQLTLERIMHFTAS
jgi:hypothetical protein